MHKPVRLVPRDDAQANASVVEILETMLDRAKAGELQAVAVVAITADGCNTSSYSAAADRMRFVGLLEWLRWRMLRDYDES